MKFIFENFLKDKSCYLKCVEYWEKIFITLLPNIEFEKYFNTTFANGEDFFDGNPIYNFRIKNSDKAVLIIQEEPESEMVYFKSWIDKFETENETIEKLVIVIELSEKTEFLTKDFVKKWIINENNSFEIENELNFINSYIPIKLNNLIYSDLFKIKKNINQLNISDSYIDKKLIETKNIKLHQLFAV